MGTRLGRQRLVNGDSLSVARCFRAPETNISLPALVSLGTLRETARPLSEVDLACFTFPFPLMSIAAPPIATPPLAAAFSKCPETHRAELPILRRRYLTFTVLRLHS